MILKASPHWPELARLQVRVQTGQWGWLSGISRVLDLAASGGLTDHETLKVLQDGFPMTMAEPYRQGRQEALQKCL